MVKMMMGKKLRKLRLDRGWSQSDVGDKVGVAGSAISMYENDQREPSLEVLEKLATIYNTTVDEIMGKDDGRTNPFSRAAFSKHDMEFGLVIARSNRMTNGGTIRLMFEGAKPILEVNNDSDDFAGLYEGLAPEDKLSICKEMIRKAMDEMTRG